MSDSWEYRVLWEFAGLPAPNLYEDELSQLWDVVGNVQDAIFTATHAVSNQLRTLAGGSSSQALDTLSEEWKSGAGARLVSLATTLGEVVTWIGETLEEIEHWKGNLVLAVGAYDIVLTVATGGGAALGSLIGENVVKAEVQRKLQAMLDQLESRLVRSVIDGTPLKALQDRIAAELQDAVDHALTSAGRSAGTLARSH